MWCVMFLVRGWKNVPLKLINCECFYVHIPVPAIECAYALVISCVCPLQEWPSLSWCCWPVWTRAPTRGSTQPFPAVSPESCRTCCTVGHAAAAAARCPTTPPRHTPPPPRTACTDRHWWDSNMTCLKRHAWVGRCSWQGRAAPHNSAATNGTAARLQRALTSTRCFQQQRTAVLATGPLSVITCPHRPTAVKKGVIEGVNTILWGHCGIYSGSQWQHVQYKRALREKTFFCSLALLRQSRAAGMQRVDHCINGLMARLMYTAEGKAVGVEKTKQWAKGEGEREWETHRQRGRLLLDWEQTGMTCRSGPEKAEVE